MNEQRKPTILCFDPGNHTGWCCLYGDGEFDAGTIGENHSDVGRRIYDSAPDIIVYETFNMYPGMAHHLAWNSFYPCEVIGVIKYLSTEQHIPIIGQAPSIKQFAGGLPQVYKDAIRAGKFQSTEHSKDATLHLAYYLRMNKQFERLRQASPLSDLTV